MKSNYCDASASRGRFVVHLLLPWGLLGSLILACSVSAQTKVYTLDADFDEGVLFNVNHDAPNNNQLQLNEVAQTFPVLYVANGGEDTLSKIDTVSDTEIARYRTWFGPAGQPGHVAHLGNPWTGPAPSRTAVDGAGNVYVANREFRNFPPTVIKILSTGFVDRNGNGTMETSMDLNASGVIGDAPGELLDLADTNGNNRIDPDEIQDERIAWATQLPPEARLARSLSIDSNGDIWVGMYSSRTYYKLSGATGAVLEGPIATTGPDQNGTNRTNTPYGSLVDANGILWGASLSNTLLKLNTVTNTVENVYLHSGGDYGIALGNARVYKARAAAPFLVFDPATEIFSSPNPSGFNRTSLGIATDGAGDIFTGAHTGGSSVGVSKFRPDSSLIWSAPPVGSSETRGTIVDSDNNVWTINRANHNVSKYRGTDGMHLVNVPVGNSPYTYSDASGSSFLQSNPQGTWQVVFDTGVAGMADCVVNYSGQVPGQSAIEVEVAVSDTLSTVGEFAGEALALIASGGTVPGAGRYVFVKATLRAGGVDNADKPILEDLSVICHQEPSDICGDLNNDRVVDAADRAILVAAYGKSVGQAGYVAAADYDSDGVVSFSDYREWYICYRKFVLQAQ